VGKGDRKTKRGKIWRGTHGKTNPKKKKKKGEVKKVCHGKALVYNVPLAYAPTLL